MTTTILSKKITVNDTFREKAEKRLQKLDRFLDEAEATVSLSPLKDDVIIELTVRFDNMLFRAEDTGRDKLDVLDACIDTIIRKIRRNKTKLEKELHRPLPEIEIYDEEDVDETEHLIVRRKTFSVKPMTVDEAILQMEMLDHNFFVYQDADADAVCVVYRRADGDYAVIEPE